MTPHVHIRPIKLIILHADIIFSMDPTCYSPESLGFGSFFLFKVGQHSQEQLNCQCKTY